MSLYLLFRKVSLYLLFRNMSAMPHNYWIACGQTSAQLWERYNLQSSWRADKLGKYEETTMMTTTIKSRLANIQNFSIFSIFFGEVILGNLIKFGLVGSN